MLNCVTLNTTPESSKLNQFLWLPTAWDQQPKGLRTCVRWGLFKSSNYLPMVDSAFRTSRRVLTRLDRNILVNIPSPPFISHAAIKSNNRLIRESVVHQEVFTSLSNHFSVAIDTPNRSDPIMRSSMLGAYPTPVPSWFFITFITYFEPFFFVLGLFIC